MAQHFDGHAQGEDEARRSPGESGQDGDRQTVTNRGIRGPSGLRGPTPELKQAADELSARLAKGDSVTDDDLRRIRSLVALDLIRSSRPTARAKGLELLEREREDELARTSETASAQASFDPRYPF